MSQENAQENVEIARGVYEAWNRGDLEAALDLMHPEIKIDYTAGVFPGLDETYEGHEGARKVLARPARSVEFPQGACGDAARDGDTVATVFTFE
jgi:ketosteroid isomerase-like protein